jgi:hypothetical protein
VNARDLAPGGAQIVYIAGAGHSGTTLLDLLLGNHPGIAAVGELNRLSLTPATRRCACGELVVACPYWTHVARGIAAHLGRDGAIDWAQFPTDLLPAPPLFSVPSHLEAHLTEHAPVPDSLRAAFAAAGIDLSDRAVVSRGGGRREVKWRVTDGQPDRRFVLRREGDHLQVYRPFGAWKDPLRRLPSFMEVALVLGSRTLLSLAARFSREAAAHVVAARNTWTIADVVCAQTRASYLLDSSKNAIRLKLLYLLRPTAFRVIYMVRDGRAVTSSAMRRRGLPANRAAAIWKRENQHIRLVLRSMPADRILRVSYEGLCDGPEATLAAACEFLGVERLPDLVRLWQRPIHNIPGNPMLFDRTVTTVRKDERWRAELSASDLALFESVAGAFNRELGYR